MNRVFCFVRSCFRGVTYAAARVLGSSFSILAGGFHILFRVLGDSGKGQRRCQECRDHEFCGECSHAVGDAATIPLSAISLVARRGPGGNPRGPA
jgi:hypothetical protein